MSNEINSLVGFDRFIFDTEKRVLWCEDEPVELPLKAIELLSVLIESSGEVVSKDELLDRVWQDSFVEESILSQNVYRLRKVFREYGTGAELIQTIPRRGYRFTGATAEIIEEECSLEHSITEQKLVAERYVAERMGSAANGNSTVSAPDDTLPAVRAEGAAIIPINKPFAYLALILLSFSAVGAGVWFWQTASSGEDLPAPAGAIEFDRMTDSGKAFSPAISRDNRHLAYVRNEKKKFSLILQHIPTKSETIVVGPVNYEIRSLYFSADGHYLFFVAVEKGTPESTIYQIPIYGGPRRKIISRVRHHFSLSPDGGQIAFFRYDPEKDETSLMVCNTDGMDERVIATRRHPDFFRVWGIYPGWSPDGKKFVVSGFTQPLDKKKSAPRSYFLEIDVETGRENIIDHPPWKTAFQAFWLGNGRGLIVSAQEDLEEYLQLWHLSYPDGRAIRITNDTNHYRDFKLAPDSKSIITSNETQYYNLYTVSLDDPERVRQLTDQTTSSYGVLGIDWTRDGRYLVYVRTAGLQDGDLWKVELETLEHTRLTFDKTAENHHPRVTPDGKSVIFSSKRAGRRHIWQIGLDGTNLRQITRGATGENYPEISDDGRWLFYNTPGTGPLELWKQPLAGGEPVKILRNAGGVSRVSPADSDRIVAYHFDPAEREKSPWKYVLFSHEVRDGLTDLGFDAENHSFDWSADGSGIYYPGKSFNQNNVWLVSVGNKARKQITDFNGLRIKQLAVSPDGRRLALSRGSSVSNILRISGFRQK